MMFGSGIHCEVNQNHGRYSTTSGSDEIVRVPRVLYRAISYSY